MRSFIFALGVTTILVNAHCAYAKMTDYIGEELPKGGRVLPAQQNNNPTNEGVLGALVHAVKPSTLSPAEHLREAKTSKKDAYHRRKQAKKEAYHRHKAAKKAAKAARKRARKEARATRIRAKMIRKGLILEPIIKIVSPQTNLLKPAASEDISNDKATHPLIVINGNPKLTIKINFDKDKKFQTIIKKDNVGEKLESSVQSKNKYSSHDGNNSNEILGNESMVHISTLDTLDDEALMHTTKLETLGIAIGDLGTKISALEAERAASNNEAQDSEKQTKTLNKLSSEWDHLQQRLTFLGANLPEGIMLDEDNFALQENKLLSLKESLNTRAEQLGHLKSVLGIAKPPAKLLYKDREEENFYSHITTLDLLKEEITSIDSKVIFNHDLTDLNSKERSLNDIQAVSNNLRVEAVGEGVPSSSSFIGGTILSKIFDKTEEYLNQVKQKVSFQIKSPDTPKQARKNSVSNHTQELGTTEQQIAEKIGALTMTEETSSNTILPKPSAPPLTSEEYEEIHSNPLAKLLNPLMQLLDTLESQGNLELSQLKENMMVATAINFLTEYLVNLNAELKLETIDSSAVEKLPNDKADLKALKMLIMPYSKINTDFEKMDSKDLKNQIDRIKLWSDILNIQIEEALKTPSTKAEKLEDSNPSVIPEISNDVLEVKDEVAEDTFLVSLKPLTQTLEELKNQKSIDLKTTDFGDIVNCSKYLKQYLTKIKGAYGINSLGVEKSAPKDKKDFAAEINDLTSKITPFLTAKLIMPAEKDSELETQIGLAEMWAKKLYKKLKGLKDAKNPQPSPAIEINLQNLKFNSNEATVIPQTKQKPKDEPLESFVVIENDYGFTFLEGERGKSPQNNTVMVGEDG